MSSKYNLSQRPFHSCKVLAGQQHMHGTQTDRQTTILRDTGPVTHQHTHGHTHEHKRVMVPVTPCIPHLALFVCPDLFHWIRLAEDIRTSCGVTNRPHSSRLDSRHEDRTRLLFIFYTSDLDGLLELLCVVFRMGTTSNICFTLWEFYAYMLES